ncbi:hypothetical protein LX36DRAFT_80714 [Colletotrichum falcatum]|nr:hypothetical protein LX36DRAFT_80714 [Colletotrichum falcatum]
MRARCRSERRLETPIRRRNLGRPSMSHVGDRCECRGVLSVSRSPWRWRRFRCTDWEDRRVGRVSGGWLQRHGSPGSVLQICRRRGFCEPRPSISNRSACRFRNFETAGRRLVVAACTSSLRNSLLASGKASISHLHLPMMDRMCSQATYINQLWHKPSHPIMSLTAIPGPVSSTYLEGRAVGTYPTYLGRYADMAIGHRRHKNKGRLRSLLTFAAVRRVFGGEYGYRVEYKYQDTSREISPILGIPGLNQAVSWIGNEAVCSAVNRFERHL